MYLTFTNDARSFLERDHSIRFIGHDGVSEFAFQADVLSGQPMNKAGYRAAFDAMRGKISSLARQAHSRCRLRRPRKPAQKATDLQ